MSSQILEINIQKSDEGSFGFSLLGKFAGIPHVIYDVIEDSPAAYCEVSSKLHKTLLEIFSSSVAEFNVFSAQPCD
jgi:hypothetical protein